MSEIEELYNNADKVKTYLSAKADSSEEILMMLEIVKMATYRGVNIHDVNKGYHLDLDIEEGSK